MLSSRRRVTVTTTIGAGVIHAVRRRPRPKPNPNAEPETMLLWPDGAPGALGKEVPIGRP